MAINGLIDAVDAFDALTAKVVGVAEALRYRGRSYADYEPDYFANLLADLLYDQADSMLDFQSWLNSVESVSYRDVGDGDDDR